ncbi:MAG: Endonuclease/exonuclease/phosphatase [Bacteroidetes bacterium]|nr:Endonuclease/exonuclease/phosphatase [Bacteroidota bacterium]
MKLKSLLFISLFFLAVFSYSQKLQKDKNYFISAIGFWNVENLYDTLNDLMKDDEEFLPTGPNAWNGARYRTKLDRLSEVISQMGTDATPDGLAILGLCEIENKSVVEDLVKTPRLKSRNYKVVHIEGPDVRGVDPSFIYNPAYFKPGKAVSYPVVFSDTSDRKTRDILVVSGSFVGEPIAILVNHWPSRAGGELISLPKRIIAGKTARRIADSISKASPETKIIIMGDLNDDPVNESVKEAIGTYGNCTKPEDGKYFNPMEKPYKEGIGTLSYQDSWNLFDQIILNKPWLPKEYDTWQYYNVRIFNKTYLKTDYGNFKGTPFRT